MSNVSHAELLGIDMKKLWLESPSNVHQMRLHREIHARSELFWHASRGKIPPVDRWVTVKRAAAHFSYAEATLYRWLRDGVVNGVKDDWRWLVDFKDLEDFIRVRKR